MRFQVRTLTLASIAIAALGLASGEMLVQAQTADKPRHCVKNLAEPDTAAVCYDNFTAAIAAATGDQITDAPPDLRDAMNDQRLLAKLNHTGEKKDTTAIAPRAGLVLGILSEDHDFEGDSLVLTGSRPCTGPLNDIDEPVAYVGDDWNDEAESIRVFNNCFARLWQHRDFRGAMLDFSGDRSDFGDVMDDEVSSIQFS